MDKSALGCASPHPISTVQEFEAKYQMTLDQLTLNGLPDNADYVMHEDYIEWHYRSRISEQARKKLETSSVFMSK